MSVANLTLNEFNDYFATENLLSIDGTLTVTNSSLWRGGFPRGTGTLVIGPNASVELANTGNVGRGVEGLAVENHGQIRWTGGHILDSHGAHWTMKDGSTLTVLTNDGSDPIVGTFTGLPQGKKFNVGGVTLQISYIGGTGNDITLTRIETPPTATVVINGGDTQRSQLTTITVAFSQAVTFPNGLAAAISLTRTGPGTPTGTVPVVFAPSGNSVTLTFSDPGFATSTGSLINGNYMLLLTAANILSGAFLLDGNGDGNGGDSQSTNTFRLYGDKDGSGTIDGNDLTQLGNAFNTNNPEFDFDGDGTVDGSDLTSFGNGFGTTL